MKGAMYLSFFGLREHPFNLTPDPRFLFMSPSHRKAFDHLLFGIQERKGFIEVLGGVGTGKTTLCRALLAEMGPEVATALILNPFLSELELLRAINREFGLEASSTSRADLVEELNGFLLARAERGLNACLILDECQNLSPQLLEQIRMLSNLETYNEKLLQIVLVGQPEFHRMLGSQELRALNERIQIRCFLEPLDLSDTRCYIQHRLSVAGARGDLVFTDSAIRAVYRYAKGVPRRINAVCDRALLLAYARGTRRITGKHARGAVEELSWKPRPLPARSPLGWGRVRTIVAYSLLAIVGITGGWGLSRLVLAPRLLEEKGLPGSPNMGAEGMKPDRGEEPLQAVATEPSAVYRRLGGLSGLVLTDMGGNLEETARRSGAEAVRLVVGFQDLLRFKRACVLEVRFPGEDGKTFVQWGVLRGVSEAGAWLQYGDSALKFTPREELERTWTGVAWAWIPSSAVKQKLRPGVRGEPVARLQAALAKLGYWEGIPTGLYDGATRRAVADFQRQNGLAADGRAGYRTIAMLLQLLGEEEAP